MAPVVLFFDTEYSQRDSAHCAPISLALVARDTGDELYLVLEGGWTPQDCSDFVPASALYKQPPQPVGPSDIAAVVRRPAPL